MKTSEVPEIKKEEPKSQETNWTNFADFKRNFTLLAERVGVDLKYVKKHYASDRTEGSEPAKDSPEEIKYRAVEALFWLYKHSGRLIIPGAFGDKDYKNAKELESDIYLEISGLWNRRRYEVPLVLEFSQQKYLDDLEGEFKKKKHELDLTRIELENLAAKLRVMRGKKKERFEREIYPIKEKLRILEGEVEYRSKTLRRCLTDGEVEFSFKERLNLLLPRLDGAAYFDVQLKVIFRVFKLVRFSFQGDEKKFKTAFDEALLRWAEKHIQDSAIVPSGVTTEKRGGRI